MVDIGRADLIGGAKPSFTESTLAARSALRRTIASQTWKVFPVLKQTSMGTCAALDNEGRCQIFPYWPLSCARFPYALHSNGRDIFYSQRCDAFWLRSDVSGAIEAMTLKAIEAYNEGIKDWVLLAYAPHRLQELGLTTYLHWPT